MKIGFIGLGNMATAIIGGLLEKRMVSAGEIAGYDAFPEAAEKIRENTALRLYLNWGM